MAVSKIAIIVFVIIVVVTGVSFFFLHRGASGIGANPGGSSTQVVRSSQVMKDLPTDPTITIGTTHGTVTVNNFYLANPPVLDDGVTLSLAETDQYAIQYDTSASTFWIIVSGMPFASWQTTAESAFLNLLKVNEADACKLAVVERVDPFSYASSTESEMIGASYPMSFCSNVGAL